MIGSTQRSAHASSWWTHSRDDLSTPEIDHFLGGAFPDTEMNLLVRALIDRTVLDDVSVAALPVVLGAAGKATLLDMVAAVVRHGRGGRERRVSDVRHMGHVERMVEAELQPSMILLDEGPAAVDSFVVEMPEPAAEEAADIASAEERPAVRAYGYWPGRPKEKIWCTDTGGDARCGLPLTATRSQTGYRTCKSSERQVGW